MKTPYVVVLSMIAILSLTLKTNAATATYTIGPSSGIANQTVFTYAGTVNFSAPGSYWTLMVFHFVHGNQDIQAQCVAPGGSSTSGGPIGGQLTFSGAGIWDCYVTVQCYDASGNPQYVESNHVQVTIVAQSGGPGSGPDV